MTAIHISHAGPDALILRFADEINPKVVPLIRAASDQLNGCLGTAIVDLVPSYTTLMVYYDPCQYDFESISEKIRQLIGKLEACKPNTRRLIEIPVWYAPEVGPDLVRLAQQHRMSVDDLVRIHSQNEYEVFAIGFAPGFAYMGNVDQAIATPRLATPRARVPAGSVAIADKQTAIYPITTPGGWNIVGRTAIKMFDPEVEGLCPVAVGDRVRFVSVSREDFVAMGGITE